MAKVLRWLVRAVAALLSLVMALLVLMLGYSAISQAARPGQLPRILGYSQLAVVSGSMMPAIQVGDLLIIRQQADYQPGDIISYQDGASLVTHRLLSYQDGMLLTQGDANNAPDRPVAPSQVAGKVMLRIPGLGSLMLWLRSPQGLILMVLLMLALSLLSYTKQSPRDRKETDTPN